MKISKKIVCGVNDGASKDKNCKINRSLTTWILVSYSPINLIDTIYRNSLCDISKRDFQNFEKNSENNTNIDYLEKSSSKEKIVVMEFIMFQ